MLAYFLIISEIFLSIFSWAIGFILNMMLSSHLQEDMQLSLRRWLKCLAVPLGTYPLPVGHCRLCQELFL